MVWQECVFMDDRDVLICIHDDEESAEECKKLSDSHYIEEHEVITKHKEK